MFSAIGRISAGRLSGTPCTHADQLRKGHPAGLIQRDAPQLRGAGRRRKAGAADTSGQMSSFRNFSTRFMPFSSLTLASAFSTV